MGVARGIAGVVTSCVLLVASGCSSSDAAGGPVSSSPLRGTVMGTAYAAGSARATPSRRDPAEKAVEVFEGVVGCGASSVAEKRTLLVVVPWQPGYVKDFSLGGDGLVGSFVLTGDARTTAVISDQGRVELIDAPSEKGAKGKMRLRMSADEGSVEGEIAVEVCD